MHWVALRGAILGFCHLAVYQSFLDFLEQPLNPFGTKSFNIDENTRKFINLETNAQVTQGDQLLMKLKDVGYFDQGRETPVTSINNIEKTNY